MVSALHLSLWYLLFFPQYKKKKMDKELGVPCQNGSIGINIEASVIAHWWD